MNPKFTNIQEDGKWKRIESFFHWLEKLYLLQCQTNDVWIFILIL